VTEGIHVYPRDGAHPPHTSSRAKNSEGMKWLKWVGKWEFAKGGWRERFLPGFSLMTLTQRSSREVQGNGVREKNSFWECDVIGNYFVSG
jgi:hypothetical protein